MPEWLVNIITYIGSGLPLAIICLCMSVIICNKTISKKVLGSFTLIIIIMFLILLRS